MKIVVAEKLSPAAFQLFADERDWNVITPEQLNGSLPKQLTDADALIVRSAVQVDAALLENATRLRVIGRAGVGVDNIDVDAATKKGVAVMNTPGANAVAVAEHTFALMLALARHIPRANETTQASKWEKKTLEGTELRGKTLGIVGLGRIGMEVARRGRAFQMNVVGHDPFVSAAVARDAGITLATLEEVISSADYLTLHVGLTPQTAGMMNAATFARMKKGARLVNCARGELVDEAALAEALRSAKLAGAALDVFTKEPPKESPLFGAPNLVLTPHIAGSTREAQEAVAVQIAQQVREYLKSGVIQNAVNVPSLSHDEFMAMQPYIVLAERLGAFLVQVAGGPLTEISIRYSGALAEWRTELIRNAAIKGVLGNAGSENTNLVNAAAMAAERGIQVHESKKEKASAGGAANVISILVSAGSSERMVKGTVLHGNAPRLLAIDDIDIEVPLERNLIYMRNRDVPGVIGRVGTLLGDSGINIASFSLGRNAGQAVGVVQVDEPAPEAVIEKLKAIGAVMQARAVTLY